MKLLAFFLLFGIMTCYNPEAAVKYARQYCQHYNKEYDDYSQIGGDCANFVSQCLIAGGQSLNECAGVKNHGVIAGTLSLTKCLLQNNWKEATTQPPGFRAGYPMASINKKSIILATSVNGKEITYCSHTNDTCDKILDYEVYYYYL